MKNQPIDEFMTGVSPEQRKSVHDGARALHEKRTRLLAADFADPDRLRRLAGEIKQHALENLDTLLPLAAERMQAGGAQVHWAVDAAAARQRVLAILQRRGATRLVKARSLVSEEIELAPFLQKHGIECDETGLGEFIGQIDHDRPSHLVRPAIHKNRRKIAASFEKNGLGADDDRPEVITGRVRELMRRKFLAADVGLTGANFLVAESGRIVVVTDEGNSRFSLAAARCHIALVGIEKVIPRDRDLAVLLNLLARSATAERLTVYTEFISGPKGAGQPDGPEEMHVIFVDHGRSEALAGECREILRCIRCGACLKVCPVYREVGGHAYRSVYPGPFGAVLSPLLAGDHFVEKADLPRASSLCGACHEVCPVDIPLPDLLLRLRNKGIREGVPYPGIPPLGPWALLASSPVAWKAALLGGRLIDRVPGGMVPGPASQAGTGCRVPPKWRGGEFRKWLKQRRKGAK